MADDIEDQPTLRVQFEAEMTIDTTVDLVTHFTGLSEKQRPAYWDFDIHQTGFEDEYERPLAWITDALTEDAQGFGSGTMRGAKAGFNDGEIQGFWEVRVDSRRLESGRVWEWTVADFDALIAAVPWLRPPDYVNEVDTSRAPGANDRPLFDIKDMERISDA